LTYPHTNGRAPPSDDGGELVLYAYVHFTGMLALLPPPLHEQAWSETVRRMRIRRRLRGGGSMDITAMSPQATHTRQSRHARRGSVSAGIWGLLSPTSPTSPASPASPDDGAFKPRHRMRASTSSPFFTPAARGIGLGVEGVGDALDDQELDAPMSVFEVPNAMLCVDVRLKPGESKSCELIPSRSIAVHAHVLRRDVYHQFARLASADIQWSRRQFLIPVGCGNMSCAPRRQQ
jgi:hypothetical protein